MQQACYIMSLPMVRAEQDELVASESVNGEVKEVEPKDDNVKEGTVRIEVQETEGHCSHRGTRDGRALSAWKYKSNMSQQPPVSQDLEEIIDQYSSPALRSSPTMHPK